MGPGGLICGLLPERRDGGQRRFGLWGVLWGTQWALSLAIAASSHPSCPKNAVSFATVSGNRADRTHGCGGSRADRAHGCGGNRAADYGVPDAYRGLRQQEEAARVLPMEEQQR